MEKPVIVFVSAVYPSQHSLLCSHLRQTGMADSWFMTMPGHVQRHAQDAEHLLSFQPDGDIMGHQGYYYASKVERSARIARGVYQAIKAFEAKQGKKVDVIVSHSMWGSTNLLYDELDAAFVSYIEFPSYRAHGWDARYPPDLSQRLTDRNMEMLHYHQVLCSDLTITPSQHARSMFPPELQSRIAVQFEGFDLSAEMAKARSTTPADARFSIGFSARDLSSAKGFETFMRLVDRMVREGQAEGVRFVALGDAQAPTYGYEQQWVQRQYGDAQFSFKDHLLKLHPAAEVVEFPGKLPYAQFAQLLGEIDLFLYPLRHGVANWGLMEILARGGCVLGSNWGFVPELVQHDVNGMLLPDADDAWIQAIASLRADPQRRQRYRQAAMETGKAFHIARVAPRYMELFRLAMLNQRTRKNAWCAVPRAPR